MTTLVLVALAGFGAQLVDGSLGMGYGVTSASLLLATGLAPAVASASVNLAQMGTTLSSGVSHWKVGNVDWRLARRLALPGGIAALAGATLLSHLATYAARPVMALLLVILGIGILVKFISRSLWSRRDREQAERARWSRVAQQRRFLTPLALVGGFFTATGGGGWGPVVTSTLLGASGTTPRRVIGSVAAAEFVVTVSASIGFIVGIGFSGMRLGLAAALMLGGVLAAPLAALAVGKMPSHLLGIAVGGMIVVLNLSPALGAVGLARSLPLWGFVLIALSLSALVIALVVTGRRARSRQLSSDLIGAGQ